MKKTVILVAALFGAATAALAAVGESMGVKLVLLSIGICTGTAIGAGISAIFSAGRRNRVGLDEEDDARGFDSAEKWPQRSSAESTLEFPQPGDPDPVAKAIYGHKDAADLLRDWHR